VRNGEGGAAPIAIGLLGPLRVRVAGVDVPVSAARERAVLARLAIDVSDCVADHELIEAVWGDRPPASARATLQTYISHLRRLLGPDAIVREPHGYRLCGAEIDVRRFDEALRRARATDDAAARAADLGRALALWRGVPLSELEDGWSTAVRAGLEEDRAHATELWLEARLSVEPAAAVVPALEELCRRHPLREHAAALLITALYRSGRQADALGAYQRLRTALVDELGLEPGPAVRDLEQRVLRHDPALLGESPAPTATPGSAPQVATARQPSAAPAPEPVAMPLPPRLASGRPGAPFVGRRDELRRVLAGLDATEADGAVRTVVVRGDAGIGKTRLAREVALAAAGRGWLVTWGRCPADAAGAFHPIAEALDLLVHWRPDLAAGHEHLLASVLPALAGRTADPLALLRAGAAQRFALLEALTQVAACAGALAPLLVVVDDVHWADAGTAAFLEHLAARRTLPVVVLATARAPEPTESEHVARLLERMQRDHDLTTVQLVGLSEAEVRAMVDRTTTTPASTSVVTALHTNTGGNPFFLGEVLAVLGDAGTPALGAPLPLTAGVQAVLAQRLDHLTVDEHEVLAAAAAIGTEFDLAGCASCAGVPEREALRALERAAAMALVEEGATPGAYSFRHGLVQAAVRERTARTRRAQLDERAAALDAARTMAEPGALGRRVANRLLADAAPSTERAVPALDDRDPMLAASRATLLRIAAGVTPLLSTPGVEAVVASDLTDERAGRTVVRWARSMHQRGQTARALARALECGELARRLPAPGLLVEAALVAAECSELLPGRPRAVLGPDVRRLLADATQASAGLGTDSAASGDAGVARARLLVHRAVAGDDPADRAMLARAARPVAQRAGSPRWEAEALLALREVTWQSGASHERLATAREVLALADGDDDLTARARISIARDLIAADRTTEADAELEIVLALPHLRPELRGAARLQQAALALAAGDQTAAAETIEWAAAGGYPRAIDDPDDPLATLLLVLAIEQGQLAEARPSLGDAVDRWPANLLWTGALAEATAEATAEDVAAAVRAQLDAATQLVERAPAHAGDIAGMVLLHRAASRVDHPLVDRLRRQLHPHRDELAIAGNVGVLGRVADLLASP
jgi:DNA-binding SARP family transcriptional activator